MSLFYHPKEKEKLSIRNKLLVDYAFPGLYKHGFIRSPFSTSWFGRNNLGSFTYEFVRLINDSVLELLVVHISSGDSYVKFFLNIFQLDEALARYEELATKNALPLYVPPLSISKMQLRSDDYKFIPIITPFFYTKHKLGFYLFKKGFDKKVNKLGRLIQRDCANINAFVRRWHELHSMQVVHLE